MNNTDPANLPSVRLPEDASMDQEEYNTGMHEVNQMDPNGKHTKHYHHYPTYKAMTRRASVTVNGQDRRRPLTMGNPGVLGLWSFATVTILLGTFNLFLPGMSNHVLLPTAIMFGGLAQYIAGFLDFFYGGTFSATILVSYGGFWTGTGLLMLPAFAESMAAYTTDFDVNRANAIYHFMWAFYTLMLLLMSLKIKAGTFILSWCLGFVFLTLLLEAVFYMTSISPILRVSGVTAYLAALGAYYSGIAAVMEEQDVVLWVGHYHQH
ncbi:GPR1/FUN34/yaaH family-domain-containing protein [Radiomyces spectabilis]|uniref:GPR1/FUN34/yaaH family-domain-containing protein n=1 Tax=Radiomyces spectabilis TaxID=64574 RepID=UPI002220EAFD|nr:GPR1/FUN34/yaaH family-domain-containing protein [Radiomyces spectabilis]KAI8370499.1 GPR1/FUN34/yaaH family-domain-containing protein [Radiomyces spectabilis]